MSVKIAESYRMLDAKIYPFYRKYDKIPKSYKIKGREELTTFLKVICKYISNEIHERKGGVHIDRLGYFFVWKIPRKMTYHFKIRGEKIVDRYNYHTDHHMYTLIYKPSIDNNATFKLWRMDRTFDHNIKREVSKKLLEGFKYKAYPFSIYRFNNK